MGFWPSSQKKKRTSTAESTEQASPFEGRDAQSTGLSLEEIGDEIGATRLAVLRHFLCSVDKNTRLKLALPTAAEEYDLNGNPESPGALL